MIVGLLPRCRWVPLVMTLVSALALSTAAGSGAQTWAVWSKWPDPIFTGQYIASDPALIDEGDFYGMFYTCFVVPDQGFDESLVRAAICEATSEDGISWEEVPVEGTTHGLVMSGRENEWDQDLEGAFAIKWQGSYLLYYSGYRHDGYPARGYPASLAVATSSDGVHFERVSSDPILERTAGWLDNDAVYSPTIVEHDGQLVMIYAGHCYTNCQSGYGNKLLAATSSDGIIWSKEDDPLLEGAIPGADWTRDGVAEPGLVKGPDQRWYLFFTGLKDEERTIGVAAGQTPFGPWDVNPEPLFSPGPDEFDSAGDLAPFVFLEGDLVRMWFLGATPEEQIAIGYAESTWPLQIPD